MPELKVAHRLIEHPDTYPADEPQRRCPDITKARLQVGYEPTGRARGRLASLLQLGSVRLRVKRLGLIGVGAWGRRYLETIARRQDCQVVAFARHTPGGGFSLAGAVPCESWRDLLGRAQDRALDGLVVATTPENQAEVAGAALAAGVPSLIEKPLGLSGAAAQDLCTALSRLPRKPPILINYVHLWAPSYRALRGLVREAQARGGKVTAIEAEGCSRGPFRGWSSLFDYGPHDLALLSGSAGERDTVRPGVRPPAARGGRRGRALRGELAGWARRPSRSRG